MVDRPKPHPAKAVLVMENRQIGEVAEQAGYCAAYVGRLLSGRWPTTSAFRHRIAEVLGRPEAELFREELSA